MRLTEIEVQAFVDVYEAEYGIRLPMEDAWEMATRLVTLYQAVSRPLPDVEDLSDARTDVEE